MAELEDPITHQKLAPELVGSPPASQTHHRARRFLTNSLPKAAFFAVFAALLAVFPSEAPEFVNQSLLTRSWELLHLLLVGIAVSYGLFSRRNADPAAEKEALHKAEETPISYVSQLLQVPSVFDDEEDDEARSGTDGSKVQLWSSQYHRVQPAVVVADGNSVYGGSGDGRSLLLPIRSLRSRIPDKESTGEDGSRAFSKSGVEHGRSGEVSSLETPPPTPREGLVGGAAVPSPVPWRSRSGRMEMREETSATAAPSCSLPPSAMDCDLGTLRSSSFRSPSSRSSSAASSPRRLSPSPSLTPELRAKTVEDTVKKKTFYKPHPPPPPPPPPPFYHKAQHPPSSERRDATRSFKNELKYFDSKPRFSADSYSPATSVRTVRPTKEATQDVKPAGKPPPPAPCEYRNGEEEPKKKMEERLEDAVVVETNCDSDSDSDSDDASEVGDLPESAPAEADENEVDKKADEFIAKFREQIRLQRIESIRRSAGQRAPPTSTK